MEGRQRNRLLEAKKGLHARAGSPKPPMASSEVDFPLTYFQSLSFIHFFLCGSCREKSLNGSAPPRRPSHLLSWRSRPPSASAWQEGADAGSGWVSGLRRGCRQCLRSVPRFQLHQGLLLLSFLFLSSSLGPTHAAGPRLSSAQAGWIGDRDDAKLKEHAAWSGV